MATITRGMLEQRAQAARAAADGEMAYYRKPSRRWGYVGWSVGLRVVTVLLLIVAAVLPFMSVDLKQTRLPFEHTSQIALAALAVAGVLMAANQVFMITATWSRHTTALMKIETLRLVFDMEWQAFVDGLAETPTRDDVNRAAELCRGLVLGARQVSEADTAAWSGELVRAVDNLQALIKEQRAASKDGGPGTST
jgi:hypothetical protein